MTDSSRLAAEAAAISASSTRIKAFATDAAANIVAQDARLAALEARLAPVYLFHDEFDGPAGSPPDPAKWVNLDGVYYDKAASRAKAANAFHDGHGNMILRVTRDPAAPGGFWGAILGSYRYQTGWPPSPVLASWPVPFRYEVKFLLPNVAGAWCGPGWLQNIDHTVAQGLWELDCGETRSTFPTLFGANQHHWTLDATGKEVDSLSESAHGVAADGRTAWHVMAVEATAVGTMYFLDGVAIASHHGVDGRFGVLLHNVIATLSSWGSGNAAPTATDPGPWDFKIDYVRVSAL